MGSSLHDDAWSGRLYDPPPAGADTWLWDTRPLSRPAGRPYRPQGPYLRADAVRLAADLNDFIRRNRSAGDPPIVGDGPFHASSSAERLERVA